MREHRQIVEQWRQGLGSILVSLVRVQGSSYRRPGARLLVCRDGSYEGSISAGCLESDLLRKAAWLIRNGAAVESYSTLFEEGAEAPFGLGCGGVLDVLLEPVETPEAEALLQAIEAAVQGREHIVATWLPSSDRPLLRAVFRDDGEAVFSSNELTANLLSQVRFTWLGKSGREPDGVCLERLIPPQRLFIFGAGNDAKPLVSMAGQLGWNVTVADGRAHLASRERFPDSNVQVLPTTELAVREIGPRDAAVIMTHSFEQDGECLAALLPLRPRYLGLLGARQRSALLISEAASKLALSVAECCEHINAPIGLDIGGEGPEAIALAILAEAQAYCAGKTSASRRFSMELIQEFLTHKGTPDFAQNPMLTCAI